MAPGSRSSRPSDGDVLRAVLDAPPRVVLDLHGSVSPELEALPGYSGIAW